MASLSRKLPVSLAELCIDTTLRCGQSFRWRKVEDEWHCSLHGRVVSLRQDDTHLHYRATWPGGQAKDRGEDDTEALLVGYFNLDRSLESMYRQWSESDANFGRKAPRFAGVRILNQDAWETLVAFICSSNNNIARISQMCHRLCDHYGGDPIATVAGHVYRDFPPPEALAGDGVEARLRELGFGYRARYIADTARAVARSRPPGWLLSLRNPQSPPAWDGPTCKSSSLSSFSSATTTTTTTTAAAAAAAATTITTNTSSSSSSSSSFPSCPSSPLSPPPPASPRPSSSASSPLSSAAPSPTPTPIKSSFPTPPPPPSYRGAFAALQDLAGVGPKVSDCVCLMGLGWGEAVPLDTHMWTIATRDYGFGRGAGAKPSALSRAMYDAVGDHFRSLWGPQAGWAQSVLFTANLREFSHRLKAPDPAAVVKAEAEAGAGAETQVRPARPSQAKPKKRKASVSSTRVKVEPDEVPVATATAVMVKTEMVDTTESPLRRSKRTRTA